MEEYIPLDFEQSELEISNAVSTLKKHGIDFELPKDVEKRINAVELFDGDDGLFKDLIKDVSVYYEYGCGKSTEYVYKFTNAEIYAVDSAEEWVNKVAGIAAKDDSSRLNLKWVDVGDVAKWGRPITYNKRHNFMTYAECLWTNQKEPDLVVIDGRFRILCFLVTLKHAPIGTKILFDDYVKRRYYHVVEELCPLKDKCGRQGLFEVTAAAKEKVSYELLLSFQNVMD